MTFYAKLCGYVVTHANMCSRSHISVMLHIKPQPSGDFDQKTHPELKKPPDPSKISIRYYHQTHQIKELFRTLQDSDSE